MMIRSVGIGILSLALLAGLGWAVLSLPEKPTGLTAESLVKLTESGVTNPVTAVLLNYRGYDTLLEVGVLLLAIAGVWSLRRGEWPAGDRRDRVDTLRQGTSRAGVDARGGLGDRVGRGAAE